MKKHIALCILVFALAVSAIINIRLYTLWVNSNKEVYSAIKNTYEYDKEILKKLESREHQGATSMLKNKLDISKDMIDLCSKENCYNKFFFK